MHDARESGNPTQHPADAFANLREEYGAYFDAIPDVDAFVREQRGGDEPDCTVWTKKIDERLEAIGAALHTQANMLQVLWLEREARG